ncbi:MAG: NfeD family protein [Lactobacillaceae bacterium]|jgi:membrane protein implicated in regulation of membrane protease activity|nr:NfeD family protein [Lactobacillaceae bacterium]
MEVVDYWIWIASGLGLIFLEILTPGFYFLWIGLAAVVVGGLNYIFPSLDFIWSGTIFAVLSVIFCYFGKVSLYKKVKSESAATLNRRGEQYIGTTVTVVGNIENGVGKVKVGDTIWSAKSKSDKEKGEAVKIVGVDGTCFIVE